MTMHSQLLTIKRYTSYACMYWSSIWFSIDSEAATEINLAGLKQCNRFVFAVYIIIL